MLLTIKNKITYTPDYDLPLIRGRDDPKTPRSWNLLSEIKNVAAPNKTWLDIGCGTGSKTFHLSSQFLQFIGLDISQQMLDKAAHTKKHLKSNNIALMRGVAEKIPLQNQTVDIITSIMSRFNAAETSRVLKPEGTVLIEYPGCQDKRDFKLFFGKDELGWRGQFIEYDLEASLADAHQHFFEFFQIVSIKSGFWNTYYSPEGLKNLLSFTPTIRNYDENIDSHSLEKAIQAFSTEKGIQLTQHRIFICAKNPKNI